MSHRIYRHQFIACHDALRASLFFLVLTGSSALPQVTNTNTVTNGGIINVGDTQIITNTVASPISAAITNDGSLQFWQTTVLTVSGLISGSGAVTKALNSGNLTLSGSNTFSGKVTISSGRLDATGVSDTVGSGLGLGTQVELGSGANLQVNVGAGTTNTTTRALIFNGSGTLGNPGSGTLVWNGNTTFNAATASTFFFNSLAGGTNVFGGVIANTTNNSAVNLNFQNTQIWSLTGSNTFSGGITIGGGKVIADKLANNGTASSIGTAATVRFGYFTSAPSTFEYVGSGSTNNMQVKLGASAGTGNNPGIFLHNGTGALVLTNANFTLASDVQAANMSRVFVLSGTNAADNTIAGIIANADGASANSTVSIVKDGTGKWILSGANTYSGGTVISNGILQIGAGGSSGQLGGGNVTNNAALVFNRTGSLSVTNNISGTGTMTTTNSGTVTLSGANTFSGKVTVASGILAASSVADSGSSSLGTGTQVELGQGSSLTFTANASNSTTRQLIVSGTTGSAALRNNGAGAVVWSGNLVNQTTAGTGEFNLGGTGTGGNEFAGLLTNNGANALRVIKLESGTWKLSGANTFSSLMDIFDGTLVATTISNSGTASSLGAGTTIRFGGFSGSGVLEYVGSGSTNNKQFKLGGGGTANTGGTILNNGSGALVFTNGTFNAAGDGAFANTTRALTLGGTNTANNAITGRIQDNNSGANTNNTISVVKTGTGKWVLSGSNTYTGGTVISNGTLQIGAGSTSGSVLGAITNNAALVFNRSDASTVTNTISGTGTLTKASGSGNLTLSGNNTFSGKVTVASGTLNAASVADSGASSLGTGTQLELGQGSSLDFTANSANSTTRQLILSGASGGAVLRNFGTGALVWSGNVVNQTTAANASFALSGTGAGNNEFAGIISNSTTGALRVAKQDTGKWILSGLNTHSGGTDIDAGTLVVTTISNTGQASSVGTGGTIRMGGFTGFPDAVLEYVGSGSTNNRQFKLGAGGNANFGGTILNNGSGALVFTNGTFNAAGDGTFANTTRALTLGGSNAADNAITGVIGDNNFGVANTNNAVSVVKDGSGKWVLSGANTYSGGTVISNGTLRLDHVLAAGAGTITQSSGASTLQINAAGTVTNTMSIYNIQTLQTVTLSGNKTLNNATYNVTNNTTTTESGQLSGSGGITKQGAGTLLIAGTTNNTYTGATLVEEGTMVLSNSGGNAIHSSSSITVNSGAALVLGASNQIGDGVGLVLNGGTFIVGTDSAGYSETLGTLTLSASSTIDLGSYATGVRQIVFADSRSITWATNAVLTITNWQGLARQSSDVAEILFGTGGLTTTQLGQIYFANQDISGGVLVGTQGELAPIPEAPVAAGAAVVVLVVLWRERRRIRWVLGRALASQDANSVGVRRVSS